MFIFQKKNTPFILISLIIIFFFVYFYSISKYHEKFTVYETFEDKKDKPYLFPTRDLQKICKEKGLEPAYGPKSCFKDGQYDPYANCECVDKETGDCKTCYSNIKEDERTSSVIYNATKF